MSIILLPLFKVKYTEFSSIYLSRIYLRIALYPHSIPYNIKNNQVYLKLNFNLKTGIYCYH